MPTTLPTQRERDPADTTPLPTVDATLHLSARTLSWLAQRPNARLVVDSVWDASASWKQPVIIRGCSPHYGWC